MGQSVTVSLRQVYRCQVLNQKQELMGTVDDVLFHPTEPRAVGFSVKPHRLGGVIALPEKYLLFENTTFNDAGQLVVALDGQIPMTDKERRQAKKAWNGSAEKRLGFSWDDSIIYYGQNVYTQDGTLLGKVSDARFDLKSGAVSVLQVTAGTSSDALLGKRTIPGELVLGFDSSAFGVACKDEAKDITLDGGGAVQAGKVVAAASEAVATAGEVASEAGKKLGDAAIKGAAKAAVYGAKTAKQVAQSPVGKKTKKWFADFVQEFKDGMNE